MNLALALAVGAGGVARAGDNGPVRTAAVAQAEELAAPVARQPGDTAQAALAAAPAAAAVTQAPPASTPTTVARPRVTAPPTTKAPVARATPAAAPAAVVPVAAVAAAPAKVARRTPTAPEVQGAIAELKAQIGGLLLLFPPTPAHIDQAGEQVCTAFDGGQSLAQVKATGLSMIPASITVPPATVDWGVRKAVALYCPGHASKLA